MITATDESVVTGIMDSNVVLGASIGIAVSVVALVILSFFVVIVVFHLRARGWCALVLFNMAYSIYSTLIIILLDTNDHEMSEDYQ
jgi:hypothetical protein